MTLTTEQLNSSNEKMCDGDSVETIEKNPKSWAAWKREAERLQKIIDDTANREAQPVAVVISRGNLAHVTDCDLELGTKLYTAPPAPAVPPEATPENIENMLADITLFFTAGSLSHGASVMFAEVWNSCRAAMLAQPVSQRYTLPDGWIACSERMPEDGDVVLVCQEGGIIYCAEMEGGALYPDEFPRVPSEGREITHWMPLPSAPEGGK